MSTSKPTTEPISGDPKRQAPDLHKGIIYQIWKSVQAWVLLSDDETLYLEGAEDFDVVSVSSGTTVQVKATAANLTLRSEAITSAMNSYWQIKRKNPARKIKFRLITTSEAGVEDGAPFGSGLKGLEIWMQCKNHRNAKLTERLINFLSTDQAIKNKLAAANHDMLSQESILTFLRTANIDQIFDDFLSGISWEMGSGDIDVAKEAVRIFINIHGEKLGLMPAECKPALDRLFLTVAETASKKDFRHLTKNIFREQFEEATCVLVPRMQIETRRRQIDLNQILSLSADSTGLITFKATSVVTIGVPQLQTEIVHRESYVVQLHNILNSIGVIAITGTSGMGKSTLGKLVAKKMTGEWIWVNFQGIPTELIPQIIKEFANKFIESTNSINLALDNLNYDPKDISHLENELAAIVGTVKSRGGKVIITTQRPLSIRIAQKISLKAEGEIQIPSLTIDEIREFCRILGCSDDHLAATWAKIVSFQAYGHPQLVHARLVGLARSLWPKPKPEDLVQPKEIAQELDLARQLLDEAPDDDKVLLYRLSILVKPFRKDHAVAIAQINPTLKYPSDVFGRLVGPWIETSGDKYYRLSPLLSNAAIHNWSTNDISILRGFLSEALLSCGKMTLLEAGEILYQGLIAQNKNTVTVITLNLFKASNKAAKSIAEVLFWLPLYRTQAGQKAFSGDPKLNFIIRITQFRIATIKYPSELENLCLLVDNEASDFEINLRATNRLLWIQVVLCSFDAKISPRRLVHYWLEIYDMLPGDAQFKEFAKLFQRKSKLITDYDDLDFLGSLLFIILTREMTCDALLEFFKAIDESPQKKRNTAVAYLQKMSYPLHMAIDRAWLNEKFELKGKCDEVIHKLNTLASTAKQWDFPVLGVYIIRAISIIEDEHQNNSAKAIDTLKSCEFANSDARCFLDEQMATILFRQKRYAEAAQIFKIILPRWPIDPQNRDSLPLHSCYRAGASAAQLDNWTLSSYYFDLGLQFSIKLKDSLRAAAFLTDCGYSNWKDSNKDAALTLFIKALVQLKKVEHEEHEALNEHSTFKAIEHIIKWCYKDSGGKYMVDAYEPPAGFCNLVQSDEKILTIPKAPLEFLWLLLAEMTLNLEANFDAMYKVIMRLRSCQYALIRCQACSLSINQSFRVGQFKRLLNTVAQFSKDAAIARAQVVDGIGKFPSDESSIVVLQPDLPSLLNEFIFYMLLALITKDEKVQPYIAIWKKEIGSITQDQVSLQCIRDIEVTPNLSADNAELVFNDESRTITPRLFGALRMATANDASLLQIFTGHIMLFNYIAKCAFRNNVAPYFGRLVKMTWSKRIQFPAEFLTPRLVVPNIANAIQTDTSGIVLAAKILQEAQYGVDVNLPDEITQTLQNLAR